MPERKRQEAPKEERWLRVMRDAASGQPKLQKLWNVRKLRKHTSEWIFVKTENARSIASLCVSVAHVLLFRGFAGESHSLCGVSVY
jgi:hypothetical protein